MASVLGCSSPFFLFVRKQLSSCTSRIVNPPPVVSLRVLGMRSMKIEGGGGEDQAVLRRPVVSPVVTEERVVEEDLAPGGEVEGVEEAEWVDWEDQILEETVPLVGIVRMILHSGIYEIDARLSPEHERTIVEKLLLYHPDSEKKIGPGIEYIKVGLHPEFEGSRCLFIVRNDGHTIDFSYWKCIKGLIRKKYPLYADSFILRHFRRQRPAE